MSQVYFIDIINGLDTNDGLDTSTAFKTVAKGVSSCVSGQGDVIYLLDKGNITESVIINKDDITLRGENQQVTISPASGSDAVTVTANNVTLVSMTVDVSIGGTDNAISATGSNFLQIRNLRVLNATDRGIVLNTCDNFKIEDTFVDNSTSHGIEITDCVDSLVKTSEISTSGVDNVRLIATGGLGSTDKVAFSDVIFHLATVNGINIGTDCQTTEVIDNCKFIENTVNILDNGTTSYIDLVATPSNIADAVWDESNLEHTADNTFGELQERQLKKIKQSIAMNHIKG
jgi:hypothetical protein